MPEPKLEALTYPRWLHHAALPSVLVETVEAATALPEGYRERTFTDEERAEAMAAAETRPANEVEDQHEAPPRTRVPPTAPPPRRR